MQMRNASVTAYYGEARDLDNQIYTSAFSMCLREFYRAVMYKSKNWTIPTLEVENRESLISHKLEDCIGDNEDNNYSTNVGCAGNFKENSHGVENNTGHTGVRQKWKRTQKTWSFEHHQWGKCNSASLGPEWFKVYWRSEVYWRWTRL